MSRRRTIASWAVALLLAASVCTLIEGVLMSMRFSLFTGGYLNPDYVKGGQIPIFLLGSIWLDAAAAALFLIPAVWLVGRLKGLNRAQRLAAVAALCIVPAEAALFLDFSVHKHIGDWLEFRGILPAGNATVVGTATLLGALVFLAGVGFQLLRSVPDRWLSRLSDGKPSVRWLLATVVLLVLGAPVVIAMTGHADERLRLQFVRKTTGHVVALLGTTLTDFDGDGRGLVNTPFDYAPFDGRRYPFAVDWPGNGVDENGLNGDLDARGDFSHEHYPEVQFVRRPDVVVFVLESFRADNLAAEVDGRPVTPNIRRLIQRGAVSGPAYSHNGYTIQSLSHLLTGSVGMTVTSSLIDDFNANGYLTACVSGQDESFGGIENATGMSRADRLIDARANASERYTVAATPATLAVPWTVVVRNIGELLREEEGQDRPVFFYVNLQDCHFPYHHEGLRPIVSSESLTRADIVPENRDRVLRAYRNSAANVDAAVGAVLETWKNLRGNEPAVVIVGDHGESVFEDGTLGHGVGLTQAQTQIPFVIAGLPVECVFPAGLAEVRSILRHALTRERDVASAIVDPGRWIFQFTGPIHAPRSVGAAYADGGLVHHFPTDENRAWGARKTAPVPHAIRFWEQLRLHRAEAAGVTPDRSN